MPAGSPPPPPQRQAGRKGSGSRPRPLFLPLPVIQKPPAKLTPRPPAQRALRPRTCQETLAVESTEPRRPRAKRMASAIFLAGGEGARLYPLTKEIPKPLLHVRGKAMLQYQLEAMIASGVSRFLICVRDTQEYAFRRFVNAWRKQYGVWIDLVIERTPLGTGGALLNATRQNAEFLGDLVLVANADIICSFPFSEMIEAFSDLQDRFDELSRILGRPLRGGKVSGTSGTDPGAMGTSLCDAPLNASDVAICASYDADVSEEYGLASDAPVSAAPGSPDAVESPSRRPCESPALAQPGCLILTTFTNTPSLFGVLETSPLTLDISPEDNPDDCLAGLLGDSKASELGGLGGRKGTSQEASATWAGDQPAGQALSIADQLVSGPGVTQGFHQTDSSVSTSIQMSAASPAATREDSELLAVSAGQTGPAVSVGAMGATGTASRAGTTDPTQPHTDSPVASPGDSPTNSLTDSPARCKLSRITSFIEKPPQYNKRRARINGGMYLFTRDCLFACLEHFCPGALTEMDLLRTTNRSVAKLTLAPLTRKRDTTLLPLGLWTVVKEHNHSGPSEQGFSASSSPQFPLSVPSAPVGHKKAAAFLSPDGPPSSAPLEQKTLCKPWQGPEISNFAPASSRHSSFGESAGPFTDGAQATSGTTPSMDTPSPTYPGSPSALSAHGVSFPWASREGAISARPMGGGAYLLCSGTPLFQALPRRTTQISLERDIFPWLLSSSRGWTASQAPESRATPSVSGYLLYALDYDSFWSDLGTIDGMIRGMQLIIGAGEGQSDVSPLSLVAPNAQILNSIVHEGVYVGEGAVITHSIIGQGVRIPPHARVNNMIIAPYSDLSSFQQH